VAEAARDAVEAWFVVYLCEEEVEAGAAIEDCVGQPFVFVWFLWIPDLECVAKEVREGDPVNRNGQGGWAGKRVAPRFQANGDETGDEAAGRVGDFVKDVVVKDPCPAA
jgi:hypothetical protein